jgi:RNA polymerase primary sigma factor
MSEEKEVEMFELFKNGNKQEQEYARNFIINANQRFVVAMAKRFATNENILDLISEGNIGLIEAMKDFDVTKGNKFITFAVWYVRRAINNYCINYGNLVKKTNLSKTYHVIAQATNKFIQTEYRQPTLEELLEIVNKEHKADIKSIEDIIDTKISSIDEGFNSEDDDAVFGEMSLYNSYSSSFNEYEKISNDDFNNKLISSMLGKLPEREKTIIKMVFGIGYYREYELQEIAEELGLTTERVRQIKNSVIKEIKEKYKNVMNNM